MHALTQWHWSFQALDKLLEGFVWPAGPFDPNGAWQHEYAIGLKIFNYQAAPKAASVGTLRIERRPADSGDGLSLSIVRTEVINEQRIALETRAAVECDDNRFCTPRAWTVETRLVNKQGNPLEGMDTRETGEIRGRRLIRHTGRVRETKLPRRVSSNWSLFDAVQRLPRGAQDLEFAMLEDLDMLRPEQALREAETIEIPTDDGKVLLRGLRQVGQGILPTYYWLDDAGRLLFVVAGLRAYIWKPPAAG